MEGTTEKLFSQAIKGTSRDGLGEAELTPELEDQSRTRSTKEQGPEVM